MTSCPDNMRLRTEPPEIHTPSMPPPPQPERFGPNVGVRYYALSANVSGIPVFMIVGSMRIPFNLFENRAAPVLLGDMLAEGTAGLDTEKFNAALDSLGAGIEAGGMGCRFDWLLKGMTRTASDSIRLLRDLLASPALPGDALERLRDIKISQVKTNMLRVDKIAQQHMVRLWYGSDSGMGQILTVEDLEKVTLDEVRELYRMAYAPDRLTLLAAGDLSEDLKHTVGDIMQTLPTGNPIALPEDKPIATQSACGAIRHHVEMPGTSQSAINFRLPGVLESDSDFHMFRQVVIALGGYFGSRLMQNLREDKSLTYNISAYNVRNPRSAFVTIASECRNDCMQYAVDEVYAELRRFAANPPQGAELERLRQYSLSSLAVSVDNPRAALAYTMSCMADGVMPEERYGRALQAIQSMTPDTLAEAAYRHLHPEQAVVVTVGA